MNFPGPGPSDPSPNQIYRRIRAPRALYNRLIFRSLGVLDTVGSRVMALIVATTVPLATIAGILAWHSYEQNVGNGRLRTEGDASLAASEISRDMDRTHTVLEMLATGNLSSENAFQEFGLVQSVSQNHFCALILADAAGKPSVILPPPSTQERAICTSNQPIITAISPLEAHATSGIDIIRGERGPLVRFVVPIFKGHTVTGYVIAIRTLGWQRTHLQGGDRRLLLGASDNARHMLMMSDGSIFSLFPDLVAPSPLPQEAALRLRHDATIGALHDVFISDNTTYALQTAYSSVSLVVATERTAAETYALHLFILRVALIVGLLTLELVGVALGARFFLVDPLERLASAVADWRRGAPFDTRINRAIPFEIRHLERAFLRATRRLTRHERNLERSAHNQDMLIREIHHRVKNNLQVIASLLNLQASRIRSTEAREEFRLVRDRVRALATLHRYLYSENGFSALDVKSFLEELCSILFSANGMGAQTRVRLELDIDHVMISPDQAVPLALVVTEAVSNALRFAFPDEMSGTISITLKKPESTESEPARRVVLQLRDDGIGMAASRARAEAGRREGIGLQLIRGFARQLDASLDIENNGGTLYTLKFVPAPPGRTAVSMAREAIASHQKQATNSPMRDREDT